VLHLKPYTLNCKPTTKGAYSDSCICKPDRTFTRTLPKPSSSPYSSSSPTHFCCDRGGGGGGALFAVNRGGISPMLPLYILFIGIKYADAPTLARDSGVILTQKVPHFSASPLTSQTTCSLDSMPEHHPTLRSLVCG